MISLVQLFREHIGCTCSMICQMHAAFTVYSFSQSCFICSSHHWYFAQSADQVYTLSDGKSAYPTGLYARCRSTNISHCVHCIDWTPSHFGLVSGKPNYWVVEWSYQRHLILICHEKRRLSLADSKWGDNNVSTWKVPLLIVLSK